MSRISNWPAALNDFIEQNKLRAFAWGSHDCALFAASAIHAITGHDPGAELRGTYHTALGAMRVFKRFGGFDALVSTLTEQNGYTPNPISLAQRGDLVLHTGKLPTLGVCCGRLSAFTGPQHLVFTPTAECRRAWRVI